MDPHRSEHGAHRTAYGVLSFLIVCAASLAACRSTRQAPTHVEDTLSEAGFAVRPADTARRLAILNSLPPNRLVWFQRGNMVNYVYADPGVCKCLYVGTADAYEKWKSTAQPRSMTQERPLAARAYPGDAWNWGTWGPWPPYPGFDSTLSGLDE